MSAFFPHINTTALASQATRAAIMKDKLSSITYIGVQKQTDIQPIITSFHDVIWAGDKMIQFNFEPRSVPRGPLSVLVHFPAGRTRLMTTICLGMSSNAIIAEVNCPRILIYCHSQPNPVGAEYVIFDKPAGESLDILWPTLSTKQQDSVCVKLAEVMFKMFNTRGNQISTTKFLVDKSANVLFGLSNDLLLARAFDDGPLVDLEPQQACTYTSDYLWALARRIDKAFPTVPESDSADPRTGWPGNEQPSKADIELIRETWARLAKLIPFHTGGWYLPESLSDAARTQAYAIMQNPTRGLYHSDLRMSRVVVHFPNGPDGPPALCLTGWEHVRFAPLWSCARMPAWVQPGHPQATPLPVGLTPERQRALQRTMYNAIRSTGGLEWVVAYAFGAMERFFEGCLSAHWMCRDAVEVGIVHIKQEWLRVRPQTQFPVAVHPRFKRMLQNGPHEALFLEECDESQYVQDDRVGTDPEGGCEFDASSVVAEFNSGSERSSLDWSTGELDSGRPTAGDKGKGKVEDDSQMVAAFNFNMGSLRSALPQVQAGQTLPRRMTILEAARETRQKAARKAARAVKALPRRLGVIPQGNSV